MCITYAWCSSASHRVSGTEKFPKKELPMFLDAVKYIVLSPLQTRAERLSYMQRPHRGGGTALCQDLALFPGPLRAFVLEQQEEDSLRLKMRSTHCPALCLPRVSHSFLHSSNESSFHGPGGPAYDMQVSSLLPSSSL